ncbi:MAG: type II toxin-antitoxin system HicB family antitoxin [Acidobacteria bacterium]|nr:type II toxin-antitoxin system HicB family antitoxin [Acidobacteriota bacterium]
MEPYQALFEEDQAAGGYVVTFPDFGYGVTQGESGAEAMEMARDLLLLTIGDYMRAGRPLPAAARRRGGKYRPVALTILQSAKVDLYTAFLASGWKKAEFARRVGIPRTHVERLFSLRHRSRLEQIEAAFAAMGKTLRLEVMSAA